MLRTQCCLLNLNKSIIILQINVESKFSLFKFFIAIYCTEKYLMFVQHAKRGLSELKQSKDILVQVIFCHNQIV